MVALYVIWDGLVWRKVLVWGLETVGQTEEHISGSDVIGFALLP